MENETLTYVTFTDSFVSNGSEAKKIKLGTNNMPLFKETLEKIRVSLLEVSLVQSHPELYDAQEMEDRREKVREDNSLSDERKQRELAYLDKLEYLVSEAKITTETMNQLPRLHRVINRILAMGEDNLKAIAEQAIDVQKLEEWKNASKTGSTIPLEETVTAETLQAAIDEVQDAFASMTKGNNLEMGDMAGLFGRKQEQAEEDRPLKPAEQETPVERDSIAQEEIPVFSSPEQMQQGAIVEEPSMGEEIPKKEEKPVESIPETVEKKPQTMHMTLDEFLNSYNREELGGPNIVVEPSKPKVSVEKTVEASEEDAGFLPPSVIEEEKADERRIFIESGEDLPIDLESLPEEVRDDPELQQMLEELKKNAAKKEEEKDKNVALTAEQNRLYQEKASAEKRKEDIQSSVEEAEREKAALIQTVKENARRKIEEQNAQIVAELDATRMENERRIEENRGLQQETAELEEMNKEGAKKAQELNGAIERLKTEFGAFVSTGPSILNRSPVGGVAKAPERVAGKTR